MLNGDCDAHVVAYLSARLNAVLARDARDVRRLERLEHKAKPVQVREVVAIRRAAATGPVVNGGAPQRKSNRPTQLVSRDMPEDVAARVLGLFPDSGVFHPAAPQHNAHVKAWKAMMADKRRLRDASRLVAPDVLGNDGAVVVTVKSKLKAARSVKVKVELWSGPRRAEYASEKTQRVQAHEVQSALALSSADADNSRH